MARRKGWTDENELIRIEAIATFARICDMADATYAAIERGDIIEAVAKLRKLRDKAARGKYLLKNLPPMELYDGVGEI